MNNQAPFFVAIGASGSEGLDDIIAVLRALAKPVPAVVMVVLHRPSDKISHLREILARACDLPVVIASEAEILKPGVCYLGEPDGHLTLMDKHLAHLLPGADHRLRNATIDALFDSLASHAADRAIGIVLSGALDDGARGLAAIDAAGGMSMVLEPGSKPRGMQQNAIDYGTPIGFVGTAEAIAARVGQVFDKFQQQRRAQPAP
jgi:two-component system, chemotaxis family, protein-glutamate methylesterase/glutaminase